jgi:uncharacterized protein (DUF58 family)
VARFRPREWLRRRSEGLARDWSRRRQGIDQLPLTLRSRRLYIVPTGAGLAFGVMVLAILAAGLNYSNGLVLLLGFLLAGICLSALHQCHRRLLDTVVESLTLDDGHAGACVTLQLRLASATALAADEYGLSLRDEADQRLQARGEGSAQTPRFVLRPAALRRGSWRLPPLRLDCEAPSGLFRCWTWLHLDSTAMVYPRPEGSLQLPAFPDGAGQANSASAGQEELFALRPFRDGDPPRHAAWRIHARGQPLQLKEWRGVIGNRLVFDFAALEGLGTEPRLSQLALWVIEASRRGETFSLCLPEHFIDMASGSEHARRCLRALAGYGQPA